MQEEDLLSEGLALMAMGMGFVFVFLTILVVTVTLMSTLVRRFQPTPAAAPKRASSAGTRAISGNDEEVMAVISAAVHRYRRSRPR
ncbi:OadG family protein [Halomonas sp. HNIBRBA4712]|uniref:OadG family protein n=1 Tax=Halomonas sp. HNIBRBA4712 TaxID=3373087 RepID=UPI0037464BF6